MNRQNPCIYDVDAGTTPARKPDDTDRRSGPFRQTDRGGTGGREKKEIPPPETSAHESFWIISLFSGKNNNETF